MTGDRVSELHWLPAWQLAEMVASCEVSAREVCSSFLDRIDRLDERVHSFVMVVPDQALAVAAALDERSARGERAGLFQGVPYSAKDNLFTAGIPTTCGSRLLKTFVPATDAGSVQRLNKAGAVLVGKANLPEFSSWRRSRNLLVGETLNPWDVSRSAGASSGGSGAAVAAGLVPISIGTDDGGSVRLPAALCGVFGFLPSPGRVPLDHTVVIGSVSQAGPICRNVRDAALFLDAMSASDTGFAGSIDQGVNGIRAAWIVRHEGSEVSDSRVVDVAHSAFTTLGEAGAQLDEPDVVWLNASQAMRPVTVQNSVEFPGLRPFDVPEFRRAAASPGWQKLLSPYLSEARLFPVGGPSPDDDAGQGASRKAVVGQFDELFARYDLLITPTIDALAAPASSDWVPGYGWPGASDAETITAYVKYTLRVNIAGCPAASVPCGFVDGMPVGLQVIGRQGQDDLVLRASRALESHRPWNEQKPSACD
jgi:Asp-tRNA(Asn)/Glu-tRNA(Gln) amidotransferase A subunit family amidase